MGLLHARPLNRKSNASMNGSAVKKPERTNFLLVRAQVP
jgi:hypothetical protein